MPAQRFSRFSPAPAVFLSKAHRWIGVGSLLHKWLLPHPFSQVFRIRDNQFYPSFLLPNPIYLPRRTDSVLARDMMIMDLLRKSMGKLVQKITPRLLPLGMRYRKKISISNSTFMQVHLIFMNRLWARLSIGGRRYVVSSICSFIINPKWWIRKKQVKEFRSLSAVIWNTTGAYSVSNPEPLPPHLYLRSCTASWCSRLFLRYSFMLINSNIFIFLGVAARNWRLKPFKAETLDMQCIVSLTYSSF